MPYPEIVQSEGSGLPEALDFRRNFVEGSSGAIYRREWTDDHELGGLTDKVGEQVTRPTKPTP